MRCNELIRLSPVRLIDQDKNMIGVVPTHEALKMAREAGMDLVEVSPNERPPVCRIMDYGKHKYNQSKKTKQKHHEQKIKEVRLRPKTDTHDKDIKLSRARRFLEQGDRVQFTMLFRGRERFHHEVGLGIFQEIVRSLEDISQVDRPVKSMGRRMTLLLAPLKTSVPAKPKPKRTAKQSGHSKSAKRQTADTPSAPSPARKSEELSPPVAEVDPAFTEKIEPPAEKAS